MQFNPLYSSLNPKLFHIQQPSPLRGAKAGHFNLALAEELQWTDEEKQAWVEICSGQRTFSEFPPLAMVLGHKRLQRRSGKLYQTTKSGFQFPIPLSCLQIYSVCFHTLYLNFFFLIFLQNFVHVRHY